MIQVDKGLTEQLKARNDDCENQLISHHKNKGSEYVPVFRESELRTGASRHSLGGSNKDLTKVEAESRAPFSLAESERSSIKVVGSKD